MTEQPGPSRHLYVEQQRRRRREQHRLTGYPRPAEEGRDPPGKPSAQGRAPARFRLVALSGDEAGEHVDLRAGRWRLGRDPSCEISVSDLSVSQFHAIVTVTERGVRIEDLGSKNHTYVNDELAEYPRELAPGDTIRLGHVTLALREASAGTADQPG